MTTIQATAPAIASTAASRKMKKLIERVLQTVP